MLPTRRILPVPLLSIAATLALVASPTAASADATRPATPGRATYECFAENSAAGITDAEILFEALPLPDDAWGPDYRVTVRVPMWDGAYVESFDAVGRLAADFAGGTLSLGTWERGEEGAPILVEKRGTAVLDDVSRGFPDGCGSLRSPHFREAGVTGFAA